MRIDGKVWRWQYAPSGIIIRRPKQKTSEKVTIKELEMFFKGEHRYGYWWNTNKSYGHVRQYLKHLAYPETHGLLELINSRKKKGPLQ